VDGSSGARDEEFRAFVVARRPALLRLATLLSAGDEHLAEDLVQTALTRLYVAWRRVEREQGPEAYARRILVNENNSIWRRAWKKREVSSDEVPERQAVSDRYDEGQSSALWDHVQTLPKKQRAVVVLRYYEELSEAETAEVLGISVGTVKSQASRALATLRQDASRHTAMSGEEER